MIAPIITLIIVLVFCVLSLWMTIRIGRKAGFARAGRVVILWGVTALALNVGCYFLAKGIDWGQNYTNFIPGLFSLALAWIFAYSRWPALEANKGRTTSLSGAPSGPGTPTDAKPFWARDASVGRPSTVQPPTTAQTRPVEQPASSPETPPPQPSLAAELERLSTLHASGALTDEEYAQAKQKLLS